MVIGIANLAMATGNLGREALASIRWRGQNNVQGSWTGLVPTSSAAIGTCPRPGARALRIRLGRYPGA